MTFTTSVKEEIAKQFVEPVSSLTLLSSFIRYDAIIKKNQITLVMENASVARLIYKLIKSTFNISPKIIVRIQRRFRIKQIYILELNESVTSILEILNIFKDGKKTQPDSYFLSTHEDQIAYLKGLFLSCGSISNPQTSGYHLEFVLNTKKDADYIHKLLVDLYFPSKVLKRSNKYMVYIKAAEMISDILKLFNATNSMFFFEDIRIYRDHKNMVNRLNNCEIANQEKTIETGLKQIEDIKYIKEHDLINLLDERIQDVISYREKYPETSFQELASIVSTESGVPITKSGINHYFRKIRELVNRNQNKNGL